MFFVALLCGFGEFVSRGSANRIETALDADFSPDPFADTEGQQHQHKQISSKQPATRSFVEGQIDRCVPPRAG